MVSQVIGVVAVLVWVSITAYHPLRRASRRPSACGCPQAEELAGLDVEEHGSPGYGAEFPFGGAAEAGNGDTAAMASYTSTSVSHD